MCESCGCGDPEIVPVEIHERILAGNDRTARHNREHFETRGTSRGQPHGISRGRQDRRARGDRPRARRTARLGALAGDLETDRDARAPREARASRPSSITTGSACHLDAELVHRALHGFPTADLDLLFIENVGNLVCPAVYDLGQAVNVVALSVTEGEDKPLKYPVMFRKADLVLLTKTDLLPHLPDVSLTALADALARVMPEPRLLPVSARTGEGLDAWLDWLAARRPAAMSGASASVVSA